jgi:hypothetical protein
MGTAQLATGDVIIQLVTTRALQPSSCTGDSLRRRHPNGSGVLRGFRDFSGSGPRVALLIARPPLRRPLQERRLRGHHSPQLIALALDFLVSVMDWPFDARGPGVAHRTGSMRPDTNSVVSRHGSKYLITAISDLYDFRMLCLCLAYDFNMYALPYWSLAKTPGSGLRRITRSVRGKLTENNFARTSTGHRCTYMKES